MMRKLLWVGDAGCESGFAKATHFILEEVRKTWDVRVLGINYRGDPHDYPYKMYPALLPGTGGDIFGVKRLLDICDKFHPDMIVLQNDPWNFPPYFRKLFELEQPPPVVGIAAVDGLNCLGRAMNKMARVIFWTHFGAQQAVEGGMKVPYGVVPLGVDLDVFKPEDKQVARTKLGLPPDVVNGFIFGNVNRNQPRKRLDLTIRYFARWRDTLSEGERKQVFLYLHVAPTGDQGIDCEQLAKYYGMTAEDPWLILAEPEMYHGTAEHYVATTYNAIDVMLSTTQGEGMGLTTLEAMACGVPCIVPKWSALGEWAAGAVRLVPCTSVSVTPRVNCIGGVVDEEMFISEMDLLYRDVLPRKVWGELGRARAYEERFRWDVVARRFAEQIELACGTVGGYRD